LGDRELPARRQLREEKIRELLLWMVRRRKVTTPSAVTKKKEPEGKP